MSDNSDGKGTGNNGEAEAKVIQPVVKKKRMGCCKCMFWTFSLIIGIAALFLGRQFIFPWHREIPDDIANNIGEEGVMTFQAFDRNQNGYIDIEEFEALYQFFKNGGNDLLLSNHSGLQTLDIEYEQEILNTDEVVSLVPSFKPLVLSSMTMEADRQRVHNHGSMVDWILSGIVYAYDTFEEGVRNFHGTPDPLKGLKEWTTPNKKFLNIAVRHFQCFFPPPSSSFFSHSDQIDVGKVYRVLDDEGSLFHRMTRDYSSNRYIPPQVKEQHIVIHQLMNVFHPRPFIVNRFQPRGTVAVVRAYNDKYMDIVFRIHAEFQLNKPPGYPFWFTPGQFTGHLVVTRDLKHIEYFHMYVPNTRKLNVDMEWLEGRENMVVDIGYMPEMSLVNTAPSATSVTLNTDDKMPEKKTAVDIIKWTTEISEAEAMRLMEVEMYPFTKAYRDNASTAPELAAKARHYLEHYSFPVMMVVAYPNGTIAHKVNANKFLDTQPSIVETGFSEPSAVHYVKFLKEGITKIENGEVAAL